MSPGAASRALGIVPLGRLQRALAGEIALAGGVELGLVPDLVVQDLHQPAQERSLALVAVLREVARRFAERRLRQVVRVLLEPQPGPELLARDLDHHLVVALEQLVEGRGVAGLSALHELQCLVVLEALGQLERLGRRRRGALAGVLFGRCHRRHCTGWGSGEGSVRGAGMTAEVITPRARPPGAGSPPRATPRRRAPRPSWPCCPACPPGPGSPSGH